MTRITITREIEAPLEHVFDTVAHVENFSKAIPHILRAVITSDVKQGVGTRFRETRLVHGHEATTDLEVTEYVPNHSIRVLADSHGTVWDSSFRVSESAGRTRLTMTMRGKAHGLLPRLMNPLLAGIIGAAVAKDLDCVKQYCEGRRPGAG